MKETIPPVALFAAASSTWLADLNSVLVTLLAFANLACIVWRFVEGRRTKTGKDDEDWKLPLKTVACLVGLSCFTGCAVVRQTLETKEGKKVQMTKSTAFTLWQSAQVVEKLRVSNGKTHSIGISGMDQDVAAGDSVTNVVNALREIRGILGK